MKLILVLLLSPSLAIGQSVFKCEENGVTVFSQRPCADDPAKVESVDVTRANRTPTPPRAAPVVMSESTKAALLLGQLQRCSDESDAVKKRYAVAIATAGRKMLTARIGEIAIADLKIEIAELEERAPKEAMDTYRTCVDGLKEETRQIEADLQNDQPDK